eukprot:6620802-Alexandrium_andersonii.AAC.1
MSAHLRGRLALWPKASSGPTLLPEEVADPASSTGRTALSAAWSRRKSESPLWLEFRPRVRL